MTGQIITIDLTYLLRDSAHQHGLKEDSHRFCNCLVALTFLYYSQKDLDGRSRYNSDKGQYIVQLPYL